MKCPYCESKINDNSLFCTFCGAKIGTEGNDQIDTKMETAPKNVNRNSGAVGILLGVLKGIVSGVKGIVSLIAFSLGILLALALYTGKLDGIFDGAYGTVNSNPDLVTRQDIADAVKGDSRIIEEKLGFSDNDDKQNVRDAIDKATEEEFNMAQSNVPSSENDEVVDTIMLYYANLHGNNNIKSEIVSDSSDSLYIRILDYDDRELGVYEYNKNTDTWMDLETKKPVDFDEAAEAYEENLSGRSGYFDYIISYSSDYPLTETDLSGLSAQELTYARNEIFARHGYIFKSAELNNYFNSKDWYYPDSSFNGKLSDLEQKNANFISNYQDEYGLTYKPE